MSRTPASKSTIAVIAGGLLLLSSCTGGSQPKPGTVLDEVRQANRPASSLPSADEDYFHDMDGGIALTADEIKGRNTWNVWTGGNDRLWDQLTRRFFAKRATP